MSDYICSACEEIFEEMPEEQLCPICFERVVDSQYQEDFLSEVEEFF